jgi:hypothetical protein
MASAVEQRIQNLSKTCRFLRCRLRSEAEILYGPENSRLGDCHNAPAVRIKCGGFSGRVVSLA